MACLSLDPPTTMTGWILPSPNAPAGLTVNCSFLFNTLHAHGCQLNDSLFDKPTHDERDLYIQYWQKKLRHNKDILFPDALKDEITNLTYDFSFAYLKEALYVRIIVSRRTDLIPTQCLCSRPYCYR